MIKKQTLWYSFFFVVLVCYSLFSYSLTDPNLVITSWSPYWQFQQWIWKFFFHNRLLLTLSYITVISLLIVGYARIVEHTKTLPFKNLILLFVVLTLPLFFSYNALSHDVFNYMFNAKMVVMYQANPHQQVALDFSTDPWVRFMHNTHTPAPYGYGWTALSLIPYFLGLNKFITTWLAFRLFALLSIALLWFALYKTAKLTNKNITPQQYALLFLNPLVILEVLGNMHNDLWMIAPAVISLGLISQKLSRKNWFVILLSGVLLGLSISIKLATVLVLPLWLALVLKDSILIKKATIKIQELSLMLYSFWPGLASLLLFFPLLTERSKQFLPWYLLWVIAWWPLMTSVKKYPKLSNWQKIWKTATLILSLTVLYRYIPWLWQGDFSGQVELYQKMITWIPFICALIGTQLYETYKK